MIHERFPSLVHLLHTNYHDYGAVISGFRVNTNICEKAYWAKGYIGCPPKKTSPASTGNILAVGQLISFNIFRKYTLRCCLNLKI